MMVRWLVAIVLGSLSCGIPGCAEKPVARVPVRPAGAPPVRAAGQKVAEDGDERIGDSTTQLRQLTGIRFDVPVDWNEQPKSEFYEAKYVIPSDEGEMVLTLTTMGGGIDANLQRWVGQFQQDPDERPRRETLRIDGTKSEWLDVRGTFRSQVGTSPGPHENWRLLGVAIPTRPRPFLLKLVGPRVAVSEFEAEFRKFARSAQLDR